MQNLNKPIPPKMHILEPKHSKLNKKEEEELLIKLNVSKSQLPKIKITDPSMPESAEIGDIIKIERKEDEETFVYYRTVI